MTTDQKTTAPKTNSWFAKQLAHLADVIAEYDNLPPLYRVNFYADRRNVYASLDDGRDGLASLRDLVRWAEAFSSTINVEGISYGLIVVTTFDMSLYSTRLDTRVLPAEAGLLAEALGWDAPPPEGKTIEVDVPAMQAAMGTLLASEERFRWEKKKASLFAQSKRFGARDEDAEAWAVAKTVEELGPRPGSGGA